MTTYVLPPVDDARIWEIWLSMYQLPAMAVANELGVFASLAERPAQESELVARLGLDPRGGRVLLDLLAALDLVSASDGVYHVTELARTYLVPTSPYYWGPLLKALGVVQPLHDALVRAVKPPPEVRAAAERPVEAWAQGTISPEMAARVTRVMHCHSLPAAVAVATSGAFTDRTRVLDVGGGSGVFAIALAQRHPHLRATIMELAAVCDVARGYVTEGGVADRVDATAVDMFREPWPSGYDAILLSNVFHDWEPARNLELARRAFEALPSGGKIFLHEMLLDAPARSPTTAGFSLLMLLSTKGRQYTSAELAQVLGEAGFTEIRAQATYARYSLVIGTKP